MSARIIPLPDGNVAFYSPYNPNLVRELKVLIPYTARKWDANQRAWIVAPEHATTLAEIAERILGERVSIPHLNISNDPITRLVKLMYLGAAKDRGNGEKFAFGWANGDWTLLFPLRVLRRWFGLDDQEHPDEATTLYAVLGIRANVAANDLKTAYRRAARQYHPDVNKEPDAKEQFQVIQRAYEVLREPNIRAKYDAGLKIAASIGASRQTKPTGKIWRPPIRCGLLLVEGLERVGRLEVLRVLQWNDIVNSQGETLVTFWPVGFNGQPEETFVERWV